MSELDNEELIATRRLHGLNDNLFKEDSDIEEDIRIIEEGIEELKGSYELHQRDWAKIIFKKINKATENILKKIKGLEEENKTEFARGYTKCKIDFTKNHIPVQTLKDKLEELKKEYIKELEKNNTKAFILKCQITIIEEILEDK